MLLEVLSKIIFFGLALVGVLIFLIKLLYGEFNDEIQTVVDKLSEHMAKLKARYAGRGCSPLKKMDDRFGTDAKLRELRYYRDLAKIDLCVLDTELKMLDAVSRAKSKYRSR